MISTGKHGRKIQLVGDRFVPVGTIFIHEPTGLCAEVAADPDEYYTCAECVFENICGSGDSKIHQIPTCSKNDREDHQWVHFKKI